MTFDDFANRFLLGLYWETEHHGQQYVRAEKIIETYGLSPKSSWIGRMAEEWEHLYFREISKTLGGYGGWAFRLSAEGYRKIEEAFADDALIAEALGLSEAENLIPAADRVVQLDHNSASYLNVSKGLDALAEAARSSNDLPDRERIIPSLSAAKVLWQAAELKVIQIKIGVLMAIEDAAKALSNTAQVVATALLIDAIKSLVKSQTNIDLDHL